MLWLPLTVIAVVGHFVALYLPGEQTGGLAVPGWDKLAHLVLFAVPAYLLGRLTRRVGLVAVFFASHAVMSELVQWWLVPDRDGDPLDALADLAGIGLAVWLLWRRGKR